LRRASREGKPEAREKTSQKPEVRSQKKRRSQKRKARSQKKSQKQTRPRSSIGYALPLFLIFLLASLFWLLPSPFLLASGFWLLA
jgi:hypothetical protein